VLAPLHRLIRSQGGEAAPRLEHPAGQLVHKARLPQASHQGGARGEVVVATNDAVNQALVLRNCTAMGRSSQYTGV
jgi:hypothetical protein